MPARLSISHSQRPTVLPRRCVFQALLPVLMRMSKKIPGDICRRATYLYNISSNTEIPVGIFVILRYLTAAGNIAYLKFHTDHPLCRVAQSI